MLLFLSILESDLKCEKDRNVLDIDGKRTKA